METNMSSEEKFIYDLLEIYHRERTIRSQPVFTQGPSVSKELLNDQQVAQKQSLKRVVKNLPKSQTLLCKETLRFGASSGSGELSRVTDQLSHIVDSVPPAQDEPEPDGDTDIIQRLVDLLKESGDKLNENIQKDQELLVKLQNCFSYSLFEKLTSAFICKVVPTTEQKIKIAWAFEMTSRLSTLDLQPMNRVMGFGAQYVHQHFAPWVQQHGGWEKAFNSDDGDEVQ